MKQNKVGMLQITSVAGRYRKIVPARNAVETGLKYKDANEPARDNIQEGFMPTNERHVFCFRLLRLNETFYVETVTVVQYATSEMIQVVL